MPITSGSAAECAERTPCSPERSPEAALVEDSQPLPTARQHLVVTTHAGSVALTLEIDEGLTQMRAVRTKLAAYRRPVASRPNWHLLVVVPGQLRAEWMLRQIRAVNLGSRASGVTLADLAVGALDTVLQSVAAEQTPGALRSLLRPPQRLLSTPVGSRAWLELLGGGGGETENGALAP